MDLDSASGVGPSARSLCEASPPRVYECTYTPGVNPRQRPAVWKPVCLALNPPPCKAVRPFVVRIHLISRMPVEACQ